ncbi:MAG: FecR family protein, partial [Acidobacteriota bacterium]
MPSRSHPTDSGDPIADALRDAGPRGPMPPLDLETLGGPARAAWRRRALARRARRRRWLVAAALVMALGAASAVWMLRQGAPIGTVTARAQGDRWGGPAVGAELAPGTRLVTWSEPPEGLALELRTGHRLRLDAGSELVLDSARKLELLRGAVYVEAADAPLRLHAAGTVSEHVGTRYEVRIVDGSAAVRVREGRVRLEAEGQVVEVGHGEVGRAAADGTLEVAPSPAYGPSWGWIRRAAPPFASDGASLEAFLQWAAAEGGFTLEVDPELLLDPSGQPALVRGSIV